MGAFSHQNVPPGHDGLNKISAPGMHSMYNHANVDPPIPNQPFMRPSPMMPGSTDALNISSVEAYRQQHEVTATVCNYCLIVEYVAYFVFVRMLNVVYISYLSIRVSKFGPPLVAC